MDGLISSILGGCKMAKDLESNLQNMTSQQLAYSCGEIVKVFSEARERLSVGSRGQDLSTSCRPLQLQSSQGGMNAGIHEHVARMFQTQLMGGSGGTSSSQGLIQGISSSMAAAGGSCAGAGLVIELGGRDVQALETSVMGSSSQRQRRRKEEGKKRREFVAAPRSGNTEIPPDDGFTWRKYGQKEILGSKHPRGYYRCTHQKLYNCPAKKQVQRMDGNPLIYEVTYRGEHTCHKSATAPSVAPPDMNMTVSGGATSQYEPLGGEWLEFRLGAAAPSTSNMNRNTDHQFPVADMADVMFNSGSSSSNSMDFIFSSNMDDHKWESGDKK